ncbi:thiamine pyrophosphate-dependent enzyme [Phaeobacter sp. C3_T13_0]|uniref:thiamine pyrophosphate-dependent enzyme n=1 Tax=Phaeobacter cretensis TaxID=3342641 RepID=UPI0039BD5854
MADAPGVTALPTDMQVIGAVQRAATDDTVVMCAAGTMPEELHKLWKSTRPISYHMEYGFSCMGYEIIGAMGIKMARPERDVICFTGDGTYMIANSEMATAQLVWGFPSLSWLRIIAARAASTGRRWAPVALRFNNLLKHTIHDKPSNIDFPAHAAAMGATSVKVGSIVEMEEALTKCGDIKGPYVIVIDTDPYPSTERGGTWWDVGVPSVSGRAEVNAAREKYETQKQSQRVQ